jgi:hypothetical protein
MPLAAAARSSSFSDRRGLPPLTGSPAQIQWAEQIRERLVRGLERHIASGQGVARTSGFQSTRDWMLTHTEARWWIDNREKKPTTVQRSRFAEVTAFYGSLFGERKRPQAARPREDQSC